MSCFFLLLLHLSYLSILCSTLDWHIYDLFYSWRSFEARFLQQEIDHFFSRDSNFSSSHPSWRTLKARYLWGNQRYAAFYTSWLFRAENRADSFLFLLLASCHQVLFYQVDLSILLYSLSFVVALFRISLSTLSSFASTFFVVTLSLFIRSLVSLWENRITPFPDHSFRKPFDSYIRRQER